jgi:hypothetical protein
MTNFKAMPNVPLNAICSIGASIYESQQKKNQFEKKKNMQKMNVKSLKLITLPR